jgi:hypothetical protein
LCIYLLGNIIEVDDFLPVLESDTPTFPYVQPISDTLIWPLLV